MYYVIFIDAEEPRNTTLFGPFDIEEQALVWACTKASTWTGVFDVVSPENPRARRHVLRQ